MFIRSLKISTNILIHAEFVAAPRAFARRHNVSLVDDVFPETKFMKDPDNPFDNKKVEQIKSNIHLIQHKAIRLFTQSDIEGHWLRSIDLGPAMLVNQAKRCVLTESDLQLALRLLSNQVSLLLAVPSDTRHIVPGNVQKDDAMSFWSEIDAECFFSGLDIRCIHHLSHPLTGPAEGSKPNYFKLGDDIDDCVIRIKKAKWEVDGAEGREMVEGVRIRLKLKGRMLTNEFSRFAKTTEVNNNLRIVAFSMQDVSCVFNEVMTRMEGFYLPKSAVSKINNESTFDCKAIALLARCSQIPAEELLASFNEMRHPSKSTQKRSKKGVAIELNNFKNIAIAEMISESAYVSLTTGVQNVSAHIDSMIADVCSKP